MFDLPAPYSLPEHSASTGASEITLRLPGTGIPRPPRPPRRMLRIYPCKRRVRNAQGFKLARRHQCSHHDKGSQARNSNFGPKCNRSAEAAKEEAATAGPTTIQPAPSTSEITMSTTITTTTTQQALTVSTITPVRTTTQQVGTDQSRSIPRITQIPPINNT